MTAPVLPGGTPMMIVPVNATSLEIIRTENDVAVFFDVKWLSSGVMIEHAGVVINDHSTIADQQYVEWVFSIFTAWKGTITQAQIASADRI